MGFATARFSISPAKRLLCSSCGGVYDDPWIVCEKEERHLICYECFNEREVTTVTIEGRESFVGCLKCGTPADKELQRPERSIAREVDRLKLHCSHKSAGCSWVGTVADVWEHESNCSEKFATCANEGCDVRLKLPALVLHRKNFCPNQKIACWRGNFDDAKHCIVLRKDLPGHKDRCQYHQCPVEDCTTRGPLATIASHVEQCTDHYERRIEDAVDLLDLEEKLSEATERISELESEVEETEEALGDCEEECHLACQGLGAAEARVTAIALENENLKTASKKLTEDLDKAKKKLPSKASTWLALGRHPDDYAAALLRTEARLAKAEAKLAKREREIRKLKRDAVGVATDDDDEGSLVAVDEEQRPAKRARFADQHGGQLVVKRFVEEVGSPDL